VRVKKRLRYMQVFPMRLMPGGNPLKNIIILGPAGSGKSSLSHAFGRWLEGQGCPVCYTNMDPGADSLPYSPDYDIRDLVTVEDIMKRERLAPNGALVRAAEIMESSLDFILPSLERAGNGSEFCIIDTPGQMEIFVFRNLGPMLTSRLNGRSLSFSLLDPSLFRGGADLVVLRLLSLLVELRLGVPSIEVLSKSDLGGGSELHRLEEEISRSEFRVTGLPADLAERLNGVVKGLEKERRIVAVSSKKAEGMDELYKAAGELFCSCGDLT
jgi:hypothetical protein